VAGWMALWADRPSWLLAPAGHFTLGALPVGIVEASCLDEADHCPQSKAHRKIAPGRRESLQPGGLVRGLRVGDQPRTDECGELRSPAKTAGSSAPPCRVIQITM